MRRVKLIINKINGLAKPLILLTLYWINRKDHGDRAENNFFAFFVV